MVATMTLKTLRGTDWTRQRRAQVSQLDAEVTVGEVVAALVQTMSLPADTPYAARFEDRKLNKTDLLSDLDLPDEAEFVLAPEVSAG